MRRLIWGFAGRTYHIVGNLLSWLNYSLWVYLGRLYNNLLHKTIGQTILLERHDHLVHTIFFTPHVTQRQVHMVETATVGVLCCCRSHVAQSSVTGSKNRKYEINKSMICHNHTQLPKGIIEPWQEIVNNVVCSTSKGLDQPAHTRSLIRTFASRLTILWILSYWLNIIWSF